MKPPRDRFDEGLMMAAALGLMPASLVAAVTEAFEPDRLTLDERRFLAGPLIVHDSYRGRGWSETLPAWVKDMAMSERIGIVFGVTPQYIVGPAEIVAVMYAAGMEGPLGRDHADLYCWATATAVAKRDGTTPAAFFANLGTKPIPDSDVLRRGGSLHETYRYLAEDIRRRVIAAQADREREGRRAAKAEAAKPKAESTPAPKPADPPPDYPVPLSLFDRR